MRKLVLLILFLSAAYLGGVQTGIIPQQRNDAVSHVDHSENAVGQSEDIFATAFSRHLSDLQVQGEGRVTRILSDDNKGSRHQRFIIELASGQALLVAHNIDLASRVSSLRVGDRVGFSGEYEWNSQGGVIHWTHHDPQGRHVGGWIRHNGVMYQ